MVHTSLVNLCLTNAESGKPRITDTTILPTYYFGKCDYL